MAVGSLPEVLRLIAAANEARRQHSSHAARELEALFNVTQRLAVYGSLAPGRANHHVLAPLGGEWTDGIVEGEVFPIASGAAIGYSAFRPRPGGPAVAVQVLTSPLLVSAWPDLDAFEGPEYRRILVPVFRAGPADERRLYTVANVYAAAAATLA